MLIDKGFKEGDVISIKLISGEEIIARFESETADEVKISRPLMVTLTGTGMGLIPWMFLGEKENFPLKRSHILAVAPSKKDAADQYMQGTTGIALR